MSGKYKEFIDWGRSGGNKRWSSEKTRLIEILRGLTTKRELDFYLKLDPSPSDLQEAIIELRKRHGRKS